MDPLNAIRRSSDIGGRAVDDALVSGAGFLGAGVMVECSRLQRSIARMLPSNGTDRNEYVRRVGEPRNVIGFVMSCVVAINVSIFRPYRLRLGVLRSKKI